MTDLICWVPQAGKLGVGLAFISYAGQIQLALFVDTDLVPDPDRLMALTYQAFEELETATRASTEPVEAQTGEAGLDAALTAMASAN
jgi:hypothetical protein